MWTVGRHPVQDSLFRRTMARPGLPAGMLSGRQTVSSRKPESRARMATHTLLDQSREGQTIGIRTFLSPEPLTERISPRRCLMSIGPAMNMRPWKNLR